ncbi:MAG: Ribosomal subunit interface protein [Labilithrix sp.]|nr:Ribosomal subunit interface protein [Labilithrix sp.]
MNIAITFRQMDATEAVKTYATEKIGKLQKFLRSPLHGSVTLSCQKTVFAVEVDVHASADHFHAHESSEDMYASIDKVVDKLERQIRDGHGAHKKKGAERASERLLPESPEKD